MSGYSRAKGRKDAGRFIALPYRCLSHTNFSRLTAKANKLFIDIAMQYNGHNNGDLCAAFTLMKGREWRSKETLYLAINELVHYGWIELTKKGERLGKRPNLYALTFQSIDECDGKLDVKATEKPSGLWLKSYDKWVRPIKYQSRFSPVKKKSQVRESNAIGTRNVLERGNVCNLR